MFAGQSDFTTLLAVFIVYAYYEFSLFAGNDQTI